MAQPTSRSAQGKFHFACRHDIFTPDELEILQRYGNGFELLASGRRWPVSYDQEGFGGSREKVKKMRGALLRDMNRRRRGM